MKVLGKILLLVFGLVMVAIWLIVLRLKGALVPALVVYGLLLLGS